MLCAYESLECVVFNIHIYIYAYAYLIYIYTYTYIYYKKTDPPSAKTDPPSALANLSTEFFLFAQMCALVHSLSSTSRFPALPMRAQICILLQMRALLHIPTFPSPHMHFPFSTYALSPTAYSPKECITTHCTTLQHTATHCTTLQHTATHRTNCNYAFFPKFVLFSTYTPFSTASFPNVKSTIWREKTRRSGATWRRGSNLSRIGGRRARYAEKAVVSRSRDLARFSPHTHSSPLPLLKM